jgi:hypothetical protein
MRVERLAALAIIVVVASAGAAGAVAHAGDSLMPLAQATQPPADQHPAAPSKPPSKPGAEPPAAQKQKESPEAQKPAPKKEAPPQPHRAHAAKPKPAPKRESMVDSQQCTWVGKRTIRVLMRDDLIAADGFLKFYRTFGCPVDHLGKAFGCSLIGTSGAPAKQVEERVDACWTDPNVKPAEAAAPEAAPQAPPGSKPGAKPAPPPKATPKSATPAPKPAPPKAKPEPETSYPKR